MKSRRRQRTVIALVVAIVDVVLLNLANLGAFWLRFESFPPAYNWAAYLRLYPWEAATLLIVFYFYGLYNYANKTSAEMKSAIVTAVLINGFIAMAITFLLVNIGFPRSVFILSVFLQIPLYGLWHLIHRSYMLRTAPAMHVLVIGPEREWPDLAVRAGQFLPRITLHYATPAMASDPVMFTDIQAVLIDHVTVKDRERYFLAAMSKNIPCLWSPEPYDVLVAGAQLTSLDNTPMFSLPSVRTRGGSFAFKRTADIVIAIFGLILTSPLMGLIALITRLDSGAPVLFRQERITSGGRTFNLVKFRTMVQNAEAATGPVLAEANDPRVTRFGRFLRATHLDELPQFWNILVGDMSLVGPRPERPVFVENFRENVPHYDLRHLTTPGLTGLAQVAGTYESSPEDKAIYDLHYAKTWNWLKDVNIVIQTLIQLIRR